MVLSFHYVLLTIEYYKIIENLSSELKDVEAEKIPRLKGTKNLIQVTNSEDTTCNIVANTFTQFRSSSIMMCCNDI